MRVLKFLSRSLLAHPDGQLIILLLLRNHYDISYLLVERESRSGRLRQDLIAQTEENSKATDLTNARQLQNKSSFSKKGECSQIQFQ